MPIFDLDIEPVLVEQLPPDKRYTKNIAWLKALAKPLQWAHNLLFKSYYEGATCPDYAPGTWNKYQQVIYQKKVYESLIDDNTDAPTADTWMLIQDDFVGLKQRVKYNGQRLVLEFALNKEFNTTFRQPPAQSDIYITNLAPVPVGFLVGSTEPFCSSVGQSTASDYIGGSYPLSYINNFQINIPAAALALTNESAIRNYVNRYLPAGLNFTIQSY